MPVSQASIPIMGLRIGKRFKEKTKGFIFPFETSFPIIPSNQIRQYKSLCTHRARATTSFAESQRNGEEEAGERILEKSKLNELSSLIIKGAINVHKELARPPRLSEPKLS